MEIPALSEHVYRILSALSGRTLHGYGILQEVEADGFDLGTGTLYSALKRLRREGVVEEVPAPDPCEDARRRHYRLTPTGEAWLAAERARLRRLLDLGHRTPAGERA